jgi:hypothetical protein
MGPAQVLSAQTRENVLEQHTPSWTRSVTSMSGWRVASL